MGKKNKQTNDKNKEEGAAKNQGGEEKKDEAKQESKINASSCKEVVLKVYMHCEGCSNKVSNSLQCFPGVVEVVTDSENNKVVVKGEKLDAIKVLERVQKKYSRNSELISPKPKAEAKPKEKKEAEKIKEPQIQSLVLKMFMHCEGCAHDIQRNLEKYKGVVMVETDMGASRVTVKGVFDAQKMVELISKRMGKHVEIVKQEKGGKDNKNKEEDKEKEKEKKKNKNKDKEEEDNMFHYPPQYHIQYLYPCQTFSDENANACSIM